MSSLSFRHLFATLTMAFAILFAASYVFAWTGPTAAPPNDNVPAPINVGIFDQIKNAGLSLDALLVSGNAAIYVPSSIVKLGINTASPVVPLDVRGTIKVGNTGETCVSQVEGGIRYNSSSKIMEYCDGSVWCPFAGCVTPQPPPPPPPPAITGGTQVYTVPGTYTFTVPPHNSLTVEAWGAGGAGGHHLHNGCRNGIASTFSSSLSAGGGTGAGCSTYRSGNGNVNGRDGNDPSPGLGGAASGGDINENGGDSTLGDDGGDGSRGGNSPSGGLGGTSCGDPWSPTGQCSRKAGLAPGGGGGGGDGGCGDEARAGGGGAHTKKTYYSGTLTAGDQITVVVGAGGAGGSCGAGPGARGEVRINWN